MAPLIVSLIVDHSNIQFAMLFVIFDVEVIFLYPWAIVFNKIGLIGLIEMLIFIGLFLVAYVYAWRKGALEWD